MSWRTFTGRARRLSGRHETPSYALTSSPVLTATSSSADRSTWSARSWPGTISGRERAQRRLSGNNGERMQPPPSQSFYRGSNRILAGVCSGLAEGFHVDVLWVRLLFVVLAFLQGLGILLYVVLWILMPERTDFRPAGRNAFDSMADAGRRAWADLRAQFGGARPVAPPTATPTSPTTAPFATASGEVSQAVP